MAARHARSLTALTAAVTLTLALLTGCAGTTTHVASGDAAAAGPAVVATPSATESEYNSPCPQGGNARRFAKTRFALHAGLALGAFHRYIYKPLRSGGFKQGAEKRKRTFAKAAVAGVFALHELKVAKGFAVANPTLCKAVEGVDGKVRALTGKLRSGTASEADLDAGEYSMNGLQSDAAKTGYRFKERNVTVPGAS
ncbi:hypothetical protein F5972_09630 [Microbispora cellulosiformans]|uniref:Lipoprotein n=1 Tax=Microbispora cellulosiformans TaxID=2614688 RepID=A0A5J5K8W5_9ACTN|nr:hypothetical protein [Microbispora cellulosiformans]KAA9379883.1 hypothetical protein F5972_09630 [Microbispora cellulosiformans]